MSDPLTLLLRAATRADVRRLWEWRNDPATRAASFVTDPIPYGDHERWMAQKLEDPNTRIFIVQDSTGETVGYIRFDLTEGEAEISISIGSRYRGQGHGSAAIRLGVQEMQAEVGIRRCVARVREDNGSSIAAFRRAGFVLEGREIVRGIRALRLVHEMHPGKD